MSERETRRRRTRAAAADGLKSGAVGRSATRPRSRRNPTPDRVEPDQRPRDSTRQPGTEVGQTARPRAARPKEPRPVRDADAFAKGARPDAIGGKRVGTRRRRTPKRR